MPQHAVPPTFYLYGEPHQPSARAFLHAETLDHRSRPSEWTIRPHAHVELNHVILIAEGGGAMRAEERVLRFAAPCLLLVPAAVVHGFEWHRDSHGAVLTFGSDLLAELVRRDPELAGLFRTADQVPLDEDEATRARDAMAALIHELGWNAPAHRSAADALLLIVLVIAARRAARERVERVAPPGRQAELVARFRERIEARFRLRETIAVHARALGTSEARLRAACADVANLAPAALLDQRALLEAKRLLFYSALQVAEVGFALGFADPAYFSRFFTRHAGCSPRTFRAASAGRERRYDLA